LIITLIAHEKNLGLLPLTDYILEKLGKENCAVFGANYLTSDISPVEKLVEEYSSSCKNIILKYVIPKQKFSNQDIKFPDYFRDRSDIVLRVPKFFEEMMNPVPLEVLKGQDNPFLITIGKYYGN
jgi:hypothetical protein